MALVRDLMTASRIESLVAAAGASVMRVDEPDQLPPAGEVDVLVVDWGDRGAGWGAAIAAWREGAEEGRRPRILLFGPHTDLASHRAARDTGLGPMRARSAFFVALPDLLASAIATDAEES
jgi:L-alanine-DL-glutamate epimerase-like enolase superfamily enzyme